MKAIAEKSKTNDATFDKSGKRGGSESHEAGYLPVSVPLSNLQIQRKTGCACGGDCPTCEAKHSDLPVSQPDDASEIEADAMADKVMRMSESESSSDKYQTKPLVESITPIIQTKSSEGGAVVDDALSSRITSSRGGGRSLNTETRTFMENSFGTDFSRVRIHTDGEAIQMNRDLNAEAFTVGNDIYFNEGQYQPNTERGRHLLAHELTHTIQQARTPSISRLYIQRHTKADCDDEYYNTCIPRCRRIRRGAGGLIARARRALCYQACMTEYAACLVSSEEALAGLLVGAAIVAAIVLAAADGPFPIGDAAAIAILASVGFTM